MIPALTDQGRLPRGRFRCELAEIQASFVDADDFAASTTRPGIWSDLDDVLQAFQSFCRIEQIWISGSFLTTKLDPGDIDCVAIIDGQRFVDQVNQDPARQAEFITFWSALRTFKTVDFFYCSWWNDEVVSPFIVSTYHQLRGYWDDFWQRDRQDLESVGGPEHAVMSKRGYLEVGLHDFKL